MPPTSFQDAREADEKLFETLLSTLEALEENHNELYLLTGQSTLAAAKAAARDIAFGRVPADNATKSTARKLMSARKQLAKIICSIENVRNEEIALPQAHLKLIQLGDKIGKPETLQLSAAEEEQLTELAELSSQRRQSLDGLHELLRLRETPDILRAARASADPEIIELLASYKEAIAGLKKATGITETNAALTAVRRTLGYLRQRQRRANRPAAPEPPPQVGTRRSVHTVSGGLPGTKRR